MARTIQEIYNAIITEKETFTELNGLTPIPETTQTLLQDLQSKSKVAIWRLWGFVIAVAIWSHEQVFVKHKQEVELLLLNRTFGQLKWYETISRLFQLGYELVWNETDLRYEYSDTTSDDAIDSKIIKQSAASEIDTTVGKLIILKVAKGTVGSLAPLSTIERGSFDAYIDRVKPAGTNISIVSDVADDLRVSITITYDPLVIGVDGGTPERGFLISDSSVYPIEDALENYIQQIGFDGFFRVMDMVDVIQAVNGVLNVAVQKASARYGALEYTDIIKVSEQKYNANAGYLSLASGHGVDEYYPELYDTGLVYSAGDWVLYSGDYYQANEEGITGAWDGGKWTLLDTENVATLKYIEG